MWPQAAFAMLLQTERRLHMVQSHLIFARRLNTAVVAAGLEHCVCKQKCHVVHWRQTLQPVRQIRMWLAIIRWANIVEQVTFRSRQTHPRNKTCLTHLSSLLQWSRMSHQVQSWTKDEIGPSSLASQCQSRRSSVKLLDCSPISVSLKGSWRFLLRASGGCRACVRLHARSDMHVIYGTW